MTIKTKEIKIVIGKTDDDEPCVKMITENEEYILLTSKTSVIAHSIVRQMQEYFQVHSFFGMAFKPIPVNGVLESIDDSRTVGIYIKASDYDKVREIFGQ